MMTHVVQTASYPPLQKSQGRGTHGVFDGGEIRAWATRPTLSAMPDRHIGISVLVLGTIFLGIGGSKIMAMRFPLYVRTKDSGEIRKYHSVQKMQSALEQIDVENDEYEVWDAEGTPVQMKSQDPVWIRFESMPGKDHPAQFRRALLEFAQSEGLQLPDQIPVGGFETALDKIQGERAKRMLASSPVRRFVSRVRSKRDS